MLILHPHHYPARPLLFALLSSFCILPSAFAPPPTQGAAAADLIRPAQRLPSLPSLPSVPFVVLPPTSTWFFSITSLPSGCNATTASFTNNASAVALDWSIPTTACGTTNPPTSFTGYEISWGPDPAQLTNTLQIPDPSTTNCLIQLLPPPLTNILLSVTTTAATNLQFAATPLGPWHFLNSTNWIATNPPSPRFFRPCGVSARRPARAQIIMLPF